MLQIKKRPKRGNTESKEEPKDTNPNARQDRHNQVIDKIAAGILTMEKLFKRAAPDARLCLELMKSTDPIPFHWTQAEVDRLYNKYKTTKEHFIDPMIELDDEFMFDEMDETGVVEVLRARAGKWYLAKPTDGRHRYWIGHAQMVGYDADNYHGVYMRWYNYDRMFGYHAESKQTQKKKYCNRP